MEQHENQDKFSTISGLESEIDEWGALNKYAILRNYKEAEEKKEKKIMARRTIREELDK